MTKKFISLTLTIFIISLVYSKEMFVTGSSVNVRTDDNSNSQIISKLNLNDKVEVLEIQGDWAKIEINGENGYAVSYTHLDVYKRQGLWRSGEQRLPGNH